jgi:FdhD protein
VSADADSEDGIELLDALPAPSLTTAAPFVARDGTVTARERILAAETPVSISYNGLAYAVMMASPVDLEDFVTGFSLTEEVVSKATEIEAIDIRPVSLGVLAQVRIADERSRAVMNRRRNIVGQTGCGICGVVELEQAVRRYPANTTTPVVSAKAIAAAFDALPAFQSLNADTGAVHAAAFASAAGALQQVREDVGRHNALDKLIGALARESRSPAEGFLLVTSRLSFELVQKALACGATALVGISAPTALAVDLARSHGLTLAGIARRDGFQIFADPYGVLAETPPG